MFLDPAMQNYRLFWENLICGIQLVLSNLLSEEPEYIWFDGKVVPANEAKISVKAHSLHYGTAVFEGIRAYYHNSELYVFRLKDHIRRLFESAQMLHLEQTFTEEEVED